MTDVEVPIWLWGESGEDPFPKLCIVLSDEVWVIDKRCHLSPNQLSDILCWFILFFCLGSFLFNLLFGRLHNLFGWLLVPFFFPELIKHLLQGYEFNIGNLFLDFIQNGRLLNSLLKPCFVSLEGFSDDLDDLLWGNSLTNPTFFIEVIEVNLSTHRQILLEVINGEIELGTIGDLVGPHEFSQELLVYLDGCWDFSGDPI